MSDALILQPALDRPDLLAEPVRALLAAAPELAAAVQVAEIDPELADTAAFCERYRVPLAESANCVLVAGRRGGKLVLAGSALATLPAATVVDGLAVPVSG